jgi:NADPH-dependent glutamate synthase beta subunit-like oxidoreductase
LDRRWLTRSAGDRRGGRQIVLNGPAKQAGAPLSVAIIGAGPAGFYTAEALLDRCEHVRIDVIERLPTPFGLIRAGVAPDHQSTKQVARRFAQTALREFVHFYGHVDVGRVISLNELRDFYDAVVLAVGAGLDRPLGIPGEHVAGCYGSAPFVGWYNGHPDFRDLAPRLKTSTAVVIGNGNVALDVARVLVKSPAEMATSDLPDYAGEAIAASGITDVHIVGRRGAEDAKFTLVELREIGVLEDCEPVVDERDIPDHIEAADERDRRSRERNLSILRGFAARTVGGKPKRIHFRFHLAPVEIVGTHAVEAVRFERTETREGGLVGTGTFERIDCGLVVAAIGYRSSPISSIPFDAQQGAFRNENGRIAPGLYAVGWAKRGPTGVIASNRPDGILCAEQILADAAQRRRRRPARAALEECLRSRGVRTITFDDWRKIDAAEVAGAAQPAPRKKLTTLSEMLALLSAEDRPLVPELPRATEALVENRSADRSNGT